MEHFFLYFLVEAARSIIKAVDGLFEKPLKKAIPNFDLLREDPQEALDHNEIVIGPRRRYFSRILLGLVLAAAGVGAFLLIFSMIERLPGQQKFGQVFWRINLSAVAISCFALGLRFFRGGYCFLRHDGVEFKYRKKMVRCSWPVFHAWGQRVYLEESDLLLLPISPDATDCILEVDQDGSTVRNVGLDVHTPQWDTRSFIEAALKPFYVVKIEELGDLLLQLGRQLGSLQSTPTHEDRPKAHRSQPKLVTFPLARREKDGWIQMNLTSFHFPPYCCICAASTVDTHVFDLQNQEESQVYPLRLPTCSQCSGRFIRGRKVVVYSGIGLAFLLAIVALLTFKPPMTQLSLLLFGSVPACFIGTFAAAERLYPRPARVRYSSSKGTFRIRFRSSEYEEMILAIRAAVEPSTS
jgi:hypothetical protein